MSRPSTSYPGSASWTVTIRNKSALASSTRSCTMGSVECEIRSTEMLIEFTVPVRVVFDVEDDTTVASVWDGRSVEDLVRAVVEQIGRAHV